MDIPETLFYDLDFHHFYITKEKKNDNIFDYLYEKIKSAVIACLKHLKIKSNSPINLYSKITFRERQSNIENKDVFVFGDIHGELEGFNDNLLNAGLIDNEGQWIGESCIMIQMGDVIDRGDKSEEAWDYLNELQKQARKKSGEVIRLTGNHELMVLQGDFSYANRVIQNPVKFAAKMKADILNGNVVLAYADGNRLYTHAGLRTKVREQIVNEIMEKHQIFVEDIVDHLNDLLVKAVENNDFSHAVFQVGYSRGGNHSNGGVLWEDVSQMLRSANAVNIPQVIAHNPPRRRGEPPIRVTESKRLINVDAGLNPLYGGQQAYVIFRGSDIIIRNKRDNCWMQAKTQNSGC